MTSFQLSMSDLAMTVSVDLSQDRFTTSIRKTHIGVSTPAYPEIEGNFKAVVKYDRAGRIWRRLSCRHRTRQSPCPETQDWRRIPLDLRITGRSGPQVIGRYLDFLKPVKKQKASRFEVQALIRGNCQTRHRGISRYRLFPSENTCCRMEYYPLHTGT